jgi:hypothetical protein
MAHEATAMHRQFFKLESGPASVFPSLNLIRAGANPGGSNRTTQFISCIQDIAYRIEMIIGLCPNPIHICKRVVLPINSFLVAPDLTRISLRVVHRLNVDERRPF